MSTILYKTQTICTDDICGEIENNEKQVPEDFSNVSFQIDFLINGTNTQRAIRYNSLQKTILYTKLTVCT